MERSSSSHSQQISHVRDEARHPLAKACDQCHRCKIACDGGRPTCERCATNGSACTYSTGKPMGKPKGSKNRSKLDAQKAPTNEVGTERAPSTQPPIQDGYGKRKTDTAGSPGTQQLSHKRQRSSICLPSPTSPNDRVSGFIRGPEASSSGPSISSVHASDQVEPEVDSAPTPEFLALQISQLHPSGVDSAEHDAPFDPEIEFGNDWLSDMSSFIHPGMPINSGMNVTNEMRSAHAAGENSRNAIQEVNKCRCAAESLAIVPELQQYATGRVKLSVDRALRLTRRGTSVISSHLDCPHHAGPNSTQTPLLACILVLMQVAACFASIRSSLDNPEHQRYLPVTVGELAIEEDETRLHVVNAVLEAGIRKAADLTTRLKDLGVQQQGGSGSLSCEPMLLLLRQELENALAGRTIINN